jgi:hypothetical protein
MKTTIFDWAQRRWFLEQYIGKMINAPTPPTENEYAKPHHH